MQCRYLRQCYKQSLQRTVLTEAKARVKNRNNSDKDKSVSISDNENDNDNDYTQLEREFEGTYVRCWSDWMIFNWHAIYLYLYISISLFLYAMVKTILMCVTIDLIDSLQSPDRSCLTWSSMTWYIQFSISFQQKHYHHHQHHQHHRILLLIKTCYPWLVHILSLVLFLSPPPNKNILSLTLFNYITL